MPAPERVKAEEGGEPQEKVAAAPPHPGGLYLSVEPDMSARGEPEAGALSLFSQSVSYEWQRSLRGLAQLAGVEGRSAQERPPQEASDLPGQHAQMFGKAVGGLLPTLVIAAGTRYAFGRILAHDVVSVENALLKRTPIGLSAAEAGATGFLSGSLLNPTQGAAKDDAGQLLFDRLQSGVRSGAEFALMSAGSIGLGKLASTERGVALGADRLMKIAAVNGLVSGAVGGFANVEVESLAQSGRLNFDQRELGKSIYEMSLFGGVFGFGAGMLGRAHNASAVVRTGSGEQLGSCKGAGDLHFSESEPAGRAVTGALTKLDQLEGYPGLKSPQLSVGGRSVRASIDFELEKLPGKLIEMSSADVVSTREKTGPVNLSAASLSREQSLIRLNGLFGEDSQTMQRLKEMDSKSLTVSLEEMAAFVGENAEQRVPMLKKVAEHETVPSRFTGDRLAGLEVLSGYFGENSESMKRLHELENYNSFIFSELRHFIKGNDRHENEDRSWAAAAGDPRRAELVKELLNGGFDSEQLSHRNLTLFSSLAEHFSLGSKEMQRLIQLGRQDANLTTVLEPLRVDNGANVPAVKEILRSGELTVEMANESDAFLRSMARLTLERNVSDPIKADGLMRAFQAQQLNGRGMLSISAFISENPERRLPLVEQQITDREQEYPYWTVERLQAIERLGDVFAAKPEVLANILRSEAFGTELDALAEFIAQDPDANKRIVEEVVAQNMTDEHGGYLDSDRLDSDRLIGLKGIYERFGEQSLTTRRILEKESEGLDVAGLGEFVGESESNGALVKSLVELGAGADELAYWRLDALAAMIKVTGEGTSLIAKVIKRLPEGLMLSELREFIEGEEKESSSSTDAKMRTEFVEKLLDEGVEPAKLSRRRLQAVYRLSQEFGEGSPTLQSLLAAEAEHELSLLGIANHLKVHPNEGPFVQKLVDSGLTSVNGYDIGALKELDQILQTDHQALGRLLQLQNVISPGSLRAFLSKSPDQLRPVLLQLLKEGASNESFSEEALRELSAFNARFGSELTLRCARIVSGGQLKSLGDFVDNHDPVGRPFLEEVLRENPSADDLDVRRLEALLTLQQTFHDAPEVVTRLRALESPTQELSVLKSFLEDSPDGGKEQVQAMVAEGASSGLFNSSQLAVRYLLEKVFSNDAARTKPILEIGDKGNSAAAVLNFLQEGGIKKEEEASGRSEASGEEEEAGLSNDMSNSFIQGVRESVETLEAFLDLGQSPQQLTAGRLSALGSLSTVYGVDASLFQRLFELEKEGLKLGTASEFVDMDPLANGRVLKAAIESGIPVKFFTMARLLDRNEVEKLSEYLPSNDSVVNYLREANQEGLSGSRARQYVSEKPADRGPVFERLAHEQAGVDRFRELMSLQVLPAEVAYALMQAAQHGGRPVPMLLSDLRDWRAGRNFREMLIEHVGSAGDLSAPALEKVAQTAREAALATGSEPVIANPLPEITDSQRAALPADIARLSDILRRATELINEKIPFDKHIVLLGRDMWQFLPLLKAQGRSVQYFLWSRLQHSEDTAPHWLKEVPPHSVVLDSGWNGTIISKAKVSDPTLTGFLLEKNYGPYEQLLTEPYDAGSIGMIESAPKLIGRTSRLAANGSAIVGTWREGGAKKRLEDPDQTDRWRFERDSRELLRSLGLPEWDAWRYSQFSGLTPKERLGLSSDAELQAHYRKIEELRSADSHAEEKL